MYSVAWPSGLRRWFKAPVSSEAWVRVPPLPVVFNGEKNLNDPSEGFIYIYFLKMCLVSHIYDFDFSFWKLFQ